MSHIVKMQASFKNMQSLKNACEKRRVPCQIAEPGHQVTAEVFSGKIKGVAAVNLKGWSYPAVIGEDGGVTYDNYNGKWGNIDELNGLRQDYAVEAAKLDLQEKGYRELGTTIEQDGTVELVMVQ